MESLDIGLFLNHQNYDLEAICEQLNRHTVHDFSHITGHEPDRIVAAARGVDILITAKATPTLPKELATDVGKLKYICHTRGVLHAYFPRELIAAGVVLSNWGNAPAAHISSLAFAHLISLSQQIPQRNISSETGNNVTIWQDYPANLQGFKVGIYGCGAIGRYMADLCHGIGMQVFIYDPWSKHKPQYATDCASLEELFKSTYAVSIHVGLSDDTRGSVDKELLLKLPKGGVIINTARGAVINEPELAELVADGRIMAGLDVCDKEGQWQDNPMASDQSTLFTGHGHWKPRRPADAPEVKWTVPDFALKNIDAFCAGEEIAHIIDLATYDRTT